MIHAFATSPTVRAIGWALMQSIWQGALIGAMTGLALTALRRGAASRRYAVACAGLAAIAAVSVVTAVVHARELRTASIHQDAVFTSASSSTDARGSAGGSPPMFNGDASHLLAATAAGRWLSRERLEAWSVIAVPLWLVGVLLLSSRLVTSWFIVERIRRAPTRPVPEVWHSRVHMLAARLRVSRSIRLVQSAVVNVPMVIGWLRPVILLPGAALMGLATGQLEAVIAHELAHIRRHDYLVNLFQTTVETLLFYHPASWWLSRQIRLEREHCCDDVAVEVCGDRLTYARALADLEELRGTDGAVAMAATGGPLLRRIRRLLGLSCPREERSATGIVVSLVLIVLSLALMGEDLKSAAGPSSALPEMTVEAMSTAQNAPGDDSVIRGRVVDARSGAPVASATVEVSENGRLVTASTDADGRYELRDLQPGDYHVFVQAAGYVPAQYGQRQPSEEGTSIGVGRGRITSVVDVRLQPADVMNGRIFADSGDGLTGVEIELLTERYLPGGVVPVAVGFAQTEAFGAFRIGELPPGEYYVRAYVSPTVRPTKADATQVYASTYFPSATRIADAQPILVTSGQEIFDVDFALVTVKMRVVTGTLVDPSGPPFDHAKVAMMARGGTSRLSHSVPVSSNGSFEIRDVVPGDYMLGVEDSAEPTRWMAAFRTLTVDDDVSDVEIIARRGTRIEGRIVRDGGDRLPFDPRMIRVGLEQRVESRPGIADAVHMFGGGKLVQADGSFSMQSPGGSSSLQISDLPSNWTVKAIRLDGSDITDQATDFGDGVRRQVEVILTDRVSQIIGVVTDRSSRVVSNYTVVVFPEDTNRWRPPSRLVRGVRSGQDGQYRIAELPPADYRAIAVESLPWNAWTDPKVLDRLWSLSTPLHLGEGEQRTVNLQLSPTADRLRLLVGELSLELAKARMASALSKDH